MRQEYSNQGRKVYAHEVYVMKVSILTSKLSILILLIMLLSAVVANISLAAEGYSASMTCTTDKTTYSVREPFTIQGAFTSNGQPVTDGLVGVEVRNPSDNTFAYRTVAIGNPQESYFTLNTNLTDHYDNPISVAKTRSVGQYDALKLRIQVTNNLLNELNATLAYTIYDNALIPIWSNTWDLHPIYGSTTLEQVDLYVPIPEWAKPGKAMISCNVYSDHPQNGGVPYTPEKLDYFDIVINKLLPPAYSQMPPSYETQAGQYKVFMKTSPDFTAQPGTYSVYASGETNGTTRATAQTTFTLLADPSPPLASFTYYPPVIFQSMTASLYENMTATFDASSSSAEGYHDNLDHLIWNITDPYNPEVITKSAPSWNITHLFSHPGTFTVILNVTDEQGLWSTISKPIVVLPESGPTANFSWTPHDIYPLTVVTFDASSSKRGWGKSTGSFSPIVQYTWSFSNDPNNVTLSIPTTNHGFEEPGNYTVTVTVTDSKGWSNTTTKPITVLNYSDFPWDVTGDGYVGIDDIFAVALHFGLSAGDPGWDPIYDITHDGYVGVDDIFEVAIHFGQEAPP
jgi:PKD repeat protein